jgi:hypothetical protein
LGPDSVAVLIVKNAPPDSGDVLLAVLGVIAAIGAAWLGGWLTARAGREAIREEFREERRRDQHTLKARMAHNLPRVIAVCDEVAELKSTEPIPLTVAEELEVLWNTYYRAAEPIFTLGSAEFQKEAELLFGKVHRVGVDIREIEELRLTLISPSALGEPPKRQQVDKGRERAGGALQELRGRAERLLADVERLPDDAELAPRPISSSGRQAAAPHWLVQILVGAFVSAVVASVLSTFGALVILRRQIEHSESLFRRGNDLTRAVATARDSIEAVVFTAQVRSNASLLRQNQRQMEREARAWPNVEVFPPLQLVVESLGSRELLPVLVVLDTTLNRLFARLAPAERSLNAEIGGRNEFKLRITGGPTVQAEGRKISAPTPNDEILRAMDQQLVPKHRAVAALADSFVAAFEERSRRAP